MCNNAFYYSAANLAIIFGIVKLFVNFLRFEGDFMDFCLRWWVCLVNFLGFGRI